MAILNTRIVLRHDLAANWQANNPTLKRGEVGIEIDTNRMKVGTGEAAWNDLEYMNGNPEEISNLITSVENITNTLGTPEDTTEDTIFGKLNSVENNYLPLAGGTLTGDLILADGGKAASEAVVDKKIDDFAAYITDNEKIDTLKELIDWVENHGAEVAEITGSISDLENLVGTTPVAEQIKVAGTHYERIKWEVSHAPARTLVDYSDKEVRVMCPADTEWTFQNSGPNSQPNLYYIGFKAYAPENAFYFKEDVNSSIGDETFYSFEGNDFAGIDEYGRKYSIIWLPVAAHDGNAWTYYGASSSESRLIGWYYTVEWYDADKNIIGGDQIRINLTNEACHTTPDPYYVMGMIKAIEVNGTELEVVNHKVILNTSNLIKESDEIAVAEDHSLVLKKVPFEKLYIDEDDEIILDGGSSAD